MNKKNQNKQLSVIEFDPHRIISLSFIKNYLRIDNDCDDEFLKSALNTACCYAEKMIGKILGKKTFELKIDTNEKINKIAEKNLFITSIIEIINNATVLTEDNFDLKNGELLFNNPVSGNIKITFTAGLDGEKVPNDIKQALLFHIASIYQNKDGNFTVPQATIDIYSTYQNIRL